MRCSSPMQKSENQVSWWWKCQSTSQPSWEPRRADASGQVWRPDKAIVPAQVGFVLFSGGRSSLLFEGGSAICSIQAFSRLDEGYPPKREQSVLPNLLIDMLISSKNIQDTPGLMFDKLSGYPFPPSTTMAQSSWHTKLTRSHGYHSIYTMISPGYFDFHSYFREEETKP